MSKHVVFISLPMSGVPDEIVLKNIELAKGAYLAITQRNIRNTVFVHNLDAGDELPEYIQADKKSVWYLGRALEKLAACDEAFFWPGWRKANGCQIEHDVCLRYKIPMIFVDTEGYRC